jgi:hydroxymethylbilane synthase
LRIATRGSALARWQAEEVAGRLRFADPACRPELVIVDTTGDRRQDVPVWEMGGQGVFVKEVQVAVLEGRADIAVHSAKDLPSRTGAGLLLGAVPVRADPRDALVGARLADLPAGATVATGSVRRRAQLSWLRPDLTFTSLRGNIATRLSRIPAGGAVVVAAAALDRLGLTDRAAEILDVSVLLPQVGQGTIAVECRADDGETYAALALIDDVLAHTELAAERGFLARLGGGCDLPVGAYARVPPRSGLVEMEGLMASVDGRILIRRSRRGPAAEAAEVGAGLAEEILSAGGAEL